MRTATAPASTGAWTAQPGFGVYLHVPFCAHRCHYCDFNTYEGAGALHEPYARALIREIDRCPDELPVPTSVFIGGGTPTLLAPGVLGDILCAVKHRFGLTPSAEVTVEANPETVDPHSLDELLEQGFTRISIGVQSTASRVLNGLGRTHTAARAVDAVRAARAAGFREVNADVIFGSPWESDADLLKTLLDVVDAGPTHVSAYALTVEEGTPLATLVGTGRIPDVDPDVQAARYEIAQRVLAGAGFERYEISNWAKPGSACRHSLLYWCNGNFLGLGAGAHGHLDGTRSWRVRLPRDYIDRVEREESTIEGSENLPSDGRVGETLMLGLRLRSGIDLDAVTDRYGPGSLDERMPHIRDLAAKGLVETDGSIVRLTSRGTFLANEVLTRLL